MITPSQYIENGVYKGAETLYGLSTDTKPTNVGNGSVFVAIDLVGSKDENGNAINFISCFDAENGEWYPQESNDNEGGD